VKCKGCSIASLSPRVDSLHNVGCVVHKHVKPKTGTDAHSWIYDVAVMEFHSFAGLRSVTLHLLRVHTLQFYKCRSMHSSVFASACIQLSTPLNTKSLISVYNDQVLTS